MGATEPGFTPNNYTSDILQEHDAFMPLRLILFELCRLRVLSLFDVM